jgi:DNA-binding MarR family transcriptional regulator
MAKTTKHDSKGVEDELLHAGATLAARLSYLVEHECKIDIVELQTLWHLQQFGKPDGEGRSVMQRYELTELLVKKFSYSDSDVSKMLDRLHDEGIVKKENLTTAERDILFGGDSGTKLAVRLMPAGRAKIETFKTTLRDRFNQWFFEQSKAIQQQCQKFEPVATSFSQWLLDRYQPSSPEEKSK